MNGNLVTTATGALAILLLTATTQLMPRSALAQKQTASAEQPADEDAGQG